MPLARCAFTTTPQYLKIHPAPVHPEELVRHECLLPTGKDLPHSFWLTSVDPSTPQQFEFRPGPAKFHSNSSEALYHAALQHLLDTVFLLLCEDEAHLRMLVENAAPIG